MGDQPLQRRQPPPYVTFRLLDSIAEGWDTWEGALALKGVDVHAWRLRTLLNAAEAQIYRSAQDENEAQRLRARLYAPPRGASGPGRPSAPAQGRGMTLAQAQALMTSVAEQDAQLTSRRSG